MNAPSRLFVTARGRSLAVCLLASAGLGACIGNPLVTGTVDPQSAVAADVNRLARANDDFPAFTEVPVRPADQRPVLMYGAAADRLIQDRAALERETAPETWTLNETDAFARSAGVRAGPEAPVTAGGNTESYAESLRRRATPPPPPKR